MAYSDYDSLSKKTFLLMITTLFMVSLWHIINEGFEYYIFERFGFNENQKLAVWVIISIFMVAMLIYYDEIHLISNIKNKSTSRFWTIMKQIGIGLIFILFWRSIWNTYSVLFDIMFDKFGIDKKFTIFAINSIFAGISLYFLVRINEEELVFT